MFLSVSVFVCYLPQASQLGVLTELGHTWPEVSKYVTHHSCVGESVAVGTNRIPANFKFWPWIEVDARCLWIMFSL